ncbi:unnamed protein product [Protopolystoma xenopodis]|uniref:Uncharacterized protein n=1 Tax=Protopolystoma xenopodis TaxID=117903 RepID=A0A3S5AHE8_9PLAT|nr:unnamed protein product [Protopolystoma xenopodis]
MNIICSRCYHYVPEGPAMASRLDVKLTFPSSEGLSANASCWSSKLTKLHCYSFPPEAASAFTRPRSDMQCWSALFDG